MTIPSATLQESALRVYTTSRALMSGEHRSFGLAVPEADHALFYRAEI